MKKEVSNLDRNIESVISIYHTEVSYQFAILSRYVFDEHSSKKERDYYSKHETISVAYSNMYKHLSVSSMYSDQGCAKFFFFRISEFSIIFRFSVFEIFQFFRRKNNNKITYLLMANRRKT